MTVMALPVGLAMQRSLIGKGRLSSAKLGIVLALVLGVVFATLFVAAPAHSAPAARFTLANGSSQQWAFGGSASSVFSCSNLSCFNGTFNGTITLSWSYYIGWVVIYTVTNVSATQTMIEIQTAINVTASFSLSESYKNSSGVTQSLSASLNVAGKETAAGFTNVTNGTVDLTHNGIPVGSTAAQAISNAASSESFNFTGSESVTGSSPGQAGTASFTFGGKEQSSVTFGTPLGIVPLNPQPGDTWNSSAPFTAAGTWSGGYSITTSMSSYNHANWTTGTVTPSGTETVNGTDLGQFTLYNNYTNPPTTVTAQAILLDFGNGVFDGADGWLLVPATLYGGIYGGLFGVGLAAHSGGLAPAVHNLPSATNTSLTSGESAYYEHGVGFVGAAATGSSLASIGGVSGPKINLKAGPEPVSVAQSQYSAITSSGGSSSSSFPWATLIILLVVVVVAILAVVMVLRRRRHPPAAMSAGASAAPMGAPSGPPSGPSGPGGPSASGGTPAALVCPTCGQAGTYIAQYGRYYCYNDKQYL